ncbi:MAG: chemotaxis protein CheW [candidate division Zixibacteria bacterium]|nr:chemotaxis protein CheW [candidate division Zixibacteria bacterium]
MAEEKTQKQVDDLEQMVTFNLGQEEFGVNILQVQEINRMVEITRVPQTENYVEGIINLRGKVIPIIDLRKKFGMAEKEYDNHTRIVVVDVANEVVGLVVDGVSEVLRVPADSLEDAPRLVSGESTYSGVEYIKSIAKLADRLLIYLDLGKIISTCELPSG